MTKPRKTASGYEVSIVATKRTARELFLEADADLPHTVADAHAKIEAMKAELEAEGYDVRVKTKYRMRAEVAQLAMPQTATEEGGEPATGDPGAVEGDEEPAGAPSLGNADPDMPAALRRSRGAKAAE